MPQPSDRFIVKIPGVEIVRLKEIGDNTECVRFCDIGGVTYWGVDEETVGAIEQAYEEVVKKMNEYGKMTRAKRAQGGGKPSR